MAKKFPKFSQDLAQDPSTRRIWYGIATGNDFESHDGMTEENLYQKIFATYFRHVAIIFLWASSLLFHVAWQGNFERWITDPLHIRPIAHAIWMWRGFFWEWGMGIGDWGLGIGDWGLGRGGVSPPYHKSINKCAIYGNEKAIKHFEKAITAFVCGKYQNEKAFTAFEKAFTTFEKAIKGFAC